MKEFELVFYRKSNGDCPVSDFIASLNKVMRYKMMNKLDMLELYGNHPKGDFTKHLDDGIFEVRAQNKTDITRILFFFDKNRQIVLTNGFVKKTQRLPAAELEAAKRYRDDYFARSKAQELAGREEDRQGYVTAGPKWRPKLDELVADASQRQATAAGERQGAKKKGTPQQGR